MSSRANSTTMIATSGHVAPTVGASVSKASAMSSVLGHFAWMILPGAPMANAARADDALTAQDYAPGQAGPRSRTEPGVTIRTSVV